MYYDSILFTVLLVPYLPKILELRLCWGDYLNFLYFLLKAEECVEPLLFFMFVNLPRLCFWVYTGFCMWLLMYSLIFRNNTGKLDVW